MKIRKIKNLPYFAEVYFAFDFTLEEIKEYFTRHNIPIDWRPNIAARYVTIEKDGLITRYIFLRGKVAADLGTMMESSLTHECLHMTFDVMKEVGITLCDESEEAFTYFHQTVFGECLDKILRNA